jgi:hypothetical protein
MYIVSVFEHTLSLELALNELEKKGIEKINIMAIPLDSIDEKKQLFDSIHGSDGVSLIDLAAALATIGMVLGVTYGFVLPWGPVIWGLIGSVIGFVIGLTFDLLKNRKTKKNKAPNKTPEVVVIIECLETHADLVKRILQENFALGVSKLR